MTTTIYSGTVPNVTIDLLHTWLWRRWLGEAFFVERHYSNPAFAQDNMEMQYATCSRRDWRGEVNAKKQPFHLHWSVYRSSDSDLDGFMDGFIEAEQWCTDSVRVVIVEHEPGLFADNLRSWLKVNYGCEVTHKQLTPKQLEQWNVLQEFATLVEQTGKEIQDVEQGAPYNLEKGGMRKRWTRLRTKIGVDPPWPRKNLSGLSGYLSG